MPRLLKKSWLMLIAIIFLIALSYFALITAKRCSGYAAPSFVCKSLREGSHIKVAKSGVLERRDQRALGKVTEDNVTVDENVGPTTNPFSSSRRDAVYSDYDQEVVTLHLLLSSEDFNEREDAIEQLVEIDSNEAIMALTSVLEDNSDNPHQIYLRELIVESLEVPSSHRSEALDIRMSLISTALFDAEPSVRLVAEGVLEDWLLDINDSSSF